MNDTTDAYSTPTILSPVELDQGIISLDHVTQPNFFQLVGSASFRPIQSLNVTHDSNHAKIGSFEWNALNFSRIRFQMQFWNRNFQTRAWLVGMKFLDFWPLLCYGSTESGDERHDK